MVESNEKNRKRNPPWTQDELVLALELYFLEPSARGDDTHSATQRLSDELNALPLHPQADRSKLFRNANGVALKLANFKRFDPAYIARGRKGLSHGSEREERVWNEFAGDFSRLTRVASAIREAGPFVASLDDAMTSEDEEATEGQILTRVHKIRERNRRLVDQKKQITIRKRGRLQCEVCSFCFGTFYGHLGEHFIECHHTVPLSDYRSSSVTKLTDLALVCANCHRMIHRSRPWLTLHELRSFLNRAGHETGSYPSA